MAYRLAEGSSVGIERGAAAFAPVGASARQVEHGGKSERNVK
jgi:hypothetical protein